MLRVVSVVAALVFCVILFRVYYLSSSSRVVFLLTTRVGRRDPLDLRSRERALHAATGPAHQLTPITECARRAGSKTRRVSFPDSESTNSAREFPSRPLDASPPVLGRSAVRAPRGGVAASPRLRPREASVSTRSRRRYRGSDVHGRLRAAPYSFDKPRRRGRERSTGRLRSWNCCGTGARRTRERPAPQAHANHGRRRVTHGVEPGRQAEEGHGRR